MPRVRGVHPLMPSKGRMGIGASVGSFLNKFVDVFVSIGICFGVFFCWLFGGFVKFFCFVRDVLCLILFFLEAFKGFYVLVFGFF